MRRIVQISGRIVAGALVLWLGTSTRLAASTTYHFDDLGPSCSPAIPAGYQGFDWSPDFQVECNADYASSYGNSYGAASGYAVTNGGAPGSGLSQLSMSGTFDFVGAEFSSFAGSDNFQAYSAESLVIYGFRPGDAPDNPTYATYIDLDPTQYVLAIPNFTGVDLLMFAGGNGPALDPNTIFGVDGLSWLMTDVEVNLSASATPEPALFMLLGACLIGAAFVLRCKSSKKNQNVEGA